MSLYGGYRSLTMDGGSDVCFLFYEKVKIEFGKLNVSLTSELLRIPCSLAHWNVRLLFIIERNGIGYVDGHRSTGSTEGVLQPVIFEYLQRRLRPNVLCYSPTLRLARPRTHL